MKYHVEEGETRYGLIEKVNARIKDGWTPLGGVTLGEKYGSYITSNKYLQAMVKE